MVCDVVDMVLFFEVMVGFDFVDFFGQGDLFVLKFFIGFKGLIVVWLFCVGVQVDFEVVVVIEYVV